MNEVMQRTDKILLEAKFDQRLKHYFLVVSSLTLLGSLIGIPLLPFWLLGLGQRIHKRQYDALESELTERSLNIRKGFLFRVQKNIPLDKITDLAVNEGPVLRYLGLCSLSVETAGGGSGTNMGQAFLPGVVDALKFRDAVLEQRDIICGQASRPTAAVEPDQENVLRDVRDTLQRIETLLREKSC